MEGKGESVFRNNYKGHMDKTKGSGWNQGREVGMAEVWGEWWGESEAIVPEQQ